MNRLKDFFYNKNDIILVLIILAVAAFIIYSRIVAIMDYPEQLAEKSAATATEETVSDESSSSVTSVTIEDTDTAATISEKLYKAGLISSSSDLQSYISSSEDKITFKSGTFQIPNGSSQEEILDIITD